MQAMVRSSVRSSGGSSAGELVLGKVVYSSSDTEKSNVHVKFNSEQHSWDYSWKSNRWEVNKTHVIDVMVLEDAGNGSLHVLKSYPSQSFTIFSARHIKANNNTAEDASITTTSGGGVGEEASRRRSRSIREATSIPRDTSLSTQKEHTPMFADVNWSQSLPSSSVGLSIQPPPPHYPRHHRHLPAYASAIYDQGELQQKKNVAYSVHSDSSSLEDDSGTGRYSHSTQSTHSSSSGGGERNSSDDGEETDGASPKRRRTESEDSKLLGLCSVIDAISRGYTVDLSERTSDGPKTGTSI